MRLATTLLLFLACAHATLAVPSAWAENVDLVTLPTREGVQLTIYNSEDLTLAKETRFVTLKKGSNRLQFSWAGTLIDPTSVELRLLGNADQVEIVDTVFPGQKPQHLIWNIESEIEGQVPIEVSYFTSGLTWRMDYVAITDPNEDRMTFRGYVRVFNDSGEDYDDAEIRLIVGTVNLVEKIAELAKREGGMVPPERSDRYEELRQRAMLGAIDMSAAAKDAPSSPAGPKQIVKEGVSEYFMFSVAGTETVPNGWSKRMRAVTADDADFDIVYRMRDYQYGPRPVRFFTWRNDEEHRLGDSPLPNGVVRVFRDNGREGLSFLGQQNLNYVPPRAEIEVNLGPDDLVVFQQRSTGTSRSDFAFHSPSNTVTGWDEHQRWIAAVRNYRDKPIRFELRLQWGGDVEADSAKPAESFDYNTISVNLDIPSRGSDEYSYSLTIHQGSNAKQNRVRLIPSR